MLPPPMEVDGEDPVATFAAQRKRRALIALAGFAALILLYIVAMGRVADSMSGPESPLAHFELSNSSEAFTFETARRDRVVLWVKVRQTHTTMLKSNTPAHAADVELEFEGRGSRCETTDVLAYGTLHRTGRTDEWLGQLASCDLGVLEPGEHTITASWTPTGASEIAVERVVLTPAFDD